MKSSMISLGGVIITLIGLPVYAVMTKKNSELQEKENNAAYDDYVGRLGIGRVYKGTVKSGEQISVCKSGSVVSRGKISKLSVYEGLKQVEVNEAGSGEIVVIAGIPDISIGETICEVGNELPMEMIHIEEPTLSMNFLVNDSPFAGKSGKFVTTRHLKDRLEKNLKLTLVLKLNQWTLLTDTK